MGPSPRVNVASTVPDRSPAEGVALDVRGVSYRYPQSEKVALAEISYTFRPGTTAIVGPNGAGKSTLVKLLTGLLAPTSGAISARLADGRCLPAEQLPKAALFQEPSHLHLTVRQNVTMRYERAPDEDPRIYRALELAGLGKVVAGLPDGIDTLVGAGFGGRLDLSGGQWQRLALARLIYQDAPVMILDEPVASLDPVGERAVFKLFSQLAHKIIIFTTHRYDSIPQDTQIVVLVDGRITEVGTHEELLRRERHYWSLYMAQAESGAVAAQPDVSPAEVGHAGAVDGRGDTERGQHGEVAQIDLLIQSFGDQYVAHLRALTALLEQCQARRLEARDEQIALLTEQLAARDARLGDLRHQLDASEGERAELTARLQATARSEMRYAQSLRVLDDQVRRLLDAHEAGQRAASNTEEQVS